MFGPSILTAVEILLLVLGIVVVLAVLAHTHEASLKVCSRLVHLFITPFEWIMQVVIHTLHVTSLLIWNALEDLRERHGDHDRAWRGWVIIGSLCSLALFIGLATCDFYTTLIKLGPILGILVPYDPVLFSLALGVSFVLVFITIALGIADLFALSPMNMFKKLADGEKRTLRKIMLGTMGLALITVILLMILATEVRAGEDDQILFGLFLCCYAVLMLIATFVAGLPLFTAIASMYILTLGVVRLVLWLVGCLLYLPYRILVLLHDFAVQVVDHGAILGRAIWNKLVPKHPIAENVASLPVLIVLDLPQFADRSLYRADVQKESAVEKLPTSSASTSAVHE